MNTRDPRCTRRSLCGRRAQRLGSQTPDRPTILRLEGRGRRAPHCRGERMGAEKHVDRPGRGGGRKMGLDPSAIQRRIRRERLLQLVRGQGPRPRGGQTTPHATILVAIRLAHRHGHAVGAHIRRGDSGDSFRPTVSSGSAGDACQRRRPAPAATPATHGSGRRLRTPSSPRAAAAAKARAKEKPASPKGATAAIRADKTPRKTGASGLGTSPAGARTRALANNGPGKMQRRRTARPKGREARRAMSSRPLGQGDASSPSPPTSCRRYLTTSRATTPPPSSRTSS